MKIERQLQGTLNTVFTELIKEKGLEGKIHPYLTQEENRADITLKNKNDKPIFFIELKDPTAKDGKSVFDAGVLMREVERAQRIDIKYFGNCNFLACAFFDKDKLYEKVSVTEGFFTIQDITRLSVNYSPNKEILAKLRSIAEFYIERALEIIDRKPITFSNIDELFIFKLRKLIEVYAYPISDKFWEKYRSNKKFEKEIQQYAQSQLWNKPTTYEEIENLTHISLLMLISKLIFYKAYVDNQLWHNLHPMKVKENVNSPEALEKLIWQYFEEFKEITGNFELLIGERTDIIFQIPFVSDAVIDLVKQVLDTEGHYNFSNIPFDIIGRIFEELIREDERHKLGQYFTPPHVIDLINIFAINRSDDKVFDPSCGSGTFLVRAYERKKMLCLEEDKGVKHELLLNEIYGNDLSGYPAYLSMLNLAIRNTKRASYPRIANKDFFAIRPITNIHLHNQKGEVEKKPFPKFDAIIGNPPYTRQEDIGTMHGTQSKDQIQQLVKSECGFSPSQRTSIYGYFFYHADAFLKENGYLAYICQNSWLDADYGVDMQKYFLNNYEIVAIMDSEVERFFPTASVNTTIVILKKQSNEKKRNSNIVKFVYFTSPLISTIKKFKGVEKLKDIIDGTLKSDENESFRINCFAQTVLAKNTSWSQFLKAPQVFFDIIERGKTKFTPLHELADVKFGIKTGCNEFFILKDITNELKPENLKVIVNNTEGLTSIKEIKREGLSVVENGYNEYWLIENKFIKPCIKSPKDADSLSTDNISKLSVLLYLNEELKEIKNHQYIYSYIKSGIRKGINQRPTTASRNLWWNLVKETTPDLMWTEMYFDRYFVLENSSKYLDIDKFYSIYLNDKKLINYYAATLNSTFYQLYREFISFSSLGDGVTKTPVYEVKLIPVIKDVILLKEVNAFWDKYRSKKTLSLFDLIDCESADEITLDKVDKDRVKLDKLFLKIIGYNEKESDIVLLKLYKALFSTVQARINKAASLKGVKTKRNKVEFSVYVDQLKNLLTEGKYSAKNTLKFANELGKLIREITSESKLQKKVFDEYWKEKFGEIYNEKDVAGKSQTKMF